MIGTPKKNGVLWRNSGFLLLWGGQTVSQIGSQVTLWALPLIAVLLLKATPFQMSILALMGRLPLLLIGLLAGVLVDRISYRVVLIVTDFGRALLIGAIPVVAWLHVLSLVHLYIVAFLVGALSVFFDVAYQSFLPSFVEPAQLVSANSKLEASTAFASIVGPGFAGALVQFISGPLALLVDACSFFVSALSLLFIRVQQAPPAVQIKYRRLRDEVGEGIRFAWRQPIIRALMLSSALFNLFDNMLRAEYVLYLTRTLGLGAALVGTIGALGGLGWLLGALLTELLTKRAGLGSTLIGSILFACVAEACIALASGPFFLVLSLVMVGEFLFQCVATTYVINSTSLRQSIVPVELRGRVNAVVRVITWGIGTFGALFGGLLAQLYDVRATLIIAAVGTLSALFLIVLSPIRKVKTIGDRNELLAHNPTHA